eukprot:scaffold1960_cov242-Pinguiococcus_pyrenoidosus.AAC.9
MLHREDEDAVRPATVRVHARGGDCPVLAPLMHELEQILGAARVFLGDALDEDPLGAMLPNLQARAATPALHSRVRAEKILDALQVQLHEACSHRELGGSRRLGDVVKDGMHDARNHSGLVAGGAHHRVRLARACLAIGEDGAVVSFQKIGHQRKGGLFKDAFLRGRRLEHAVVAELAAHFLEAVDAIVQNAHGDLVFAEMHAGRRALLSLERILRTKAHAHAHVLRTAAGTAELAALLARRHRTTRRASRRLLGRRHHRQRLLKRRRVAPLLPGVLHALRGLRFTHSLCGSRLTVPSHSKP